MRTVALPGGGVARIRQLTGLEEDRLARLGPMPAALAVTNLVGTCVEVGDRPASPEVARSMLIGDRDYAMLQLRAETLGERILAVVVCPACGAKLDVEFDVGEVPVERRPHRERYEVRYRGRRIGFRLPTGEDAEAIAELDLETAQGLLLERCVDAAQWPLSRGAQVAVDAAMERAAPAVDLELDIHCVECGAATVVAFDCVAFFLRELNLRADNLIREVHTLATHYHWSEESILALPRSRRHSYLRLVQEARSA